MLIVAGCCDGAAEVGGSELVAWDEAVATSGLCRWVLWILMIEAGCMTHRPSPVGRPTCQGQGKCTRIVALHFSTRQLTVWATRLISLRANELQTKDNAASTRGQSPSPTWLVLQDAAEVGQASCSLGGSARRS